jgi:hypothetical protein
LSCFQRAAAQDRPTNLTLETRAVRRRHPVPQAALPPRQAAQVRAVRLAQAAARQGLYLLRATGRDANRVMVQTEKMAQHRLI